MRYTLKLGTAYVKQEKNGRKIAIISSTCISKQAQSACKVDEISGLCGVITMGCNLGNQLNSLDSELYFH